MSNTIRKAALLQKRKWRIRKKVVGTAVRPRLSVKFSGKHIYAQAIDDDAGKTLVFLSTLDADVKKQNATSPAPSSSAAPSPPRPSPPASPPSSSTATAAPSTAASKPSPMPPARVVSNSKHRPWLTTTDPIPPTRPPTAPSPA
jgi:hypothetical protein